MRASGVRLILVTIAILQCTAWWTSLAATARGSEREQLIPVVRAVGPRTIVVISDLHFGVGPGPTTWHPYEDFRWSREFADFLSAIDKRNQHPVDLVIAGDMFELWQSNDGDCQPSGPSDLGCNEEDAEKRLRKIIEAHSAEMLALKAFADHDDNRLVIIPGNHDSALLYPKVRALLAEHFTGVRYEIAHEGYWMPADGRILIEHGHQVYEDANWFDGWPEPFIDDKGAPRLRRTAGEDFVRAVFNRWEADYPIIDNVTDEGMGIKLVFAKEGARGVAREVPSILKHILLESTKAQLEGWLGGDKEVPEWDYARARGRGVELWGDVLLPEDPGRRLFGAGETQISPNDLSDEELRLICDVAAAYRDLSGNAQERIPGCQRVAGGLGGDGGDLGQLTKSMFRTRNEAFATYLKSRAKKVTPAGRSAFEFYVFGHTHRAEEFTPMKHAWSPVVLNDGAWQRLSSPKRLEKLVQARGKDATAALALIPEDLPAEYDLLIFEEWMAKPALWCWSGSVESRLIEEPCPR